MSEFEIRRSIVINTSPEQVYPHLIDFHQWRAWSPWEGMDPELERTYSEPASGPGARYAWKGNRKVGEGSMTIAGAEEPTQVRVDLVFLRPFKAENKVIFELTPRTGATSVDWIMRGERKGLRDKIVGALFPLDKFVGKDFEKGLAQLKATVESGA